MNAPSPARAAALRTLLAAVLVAFLSACVVYYSPPAELSPQSMIVRFATERGESAVFRSGELLRFTLESAHAGFVSLWATDPDGRVYELARNVAVRQGNNSIGGPTPNTRFRLAPPGGEHQVRAFFRDRPFPETARDPERTVMLSAQDSAETRFLVLVR